MNEDINAVVVEHGGKSYITVLRSYYVDQKQIAANGQCGLPNAPGDSAFLVYDGKVKTLEKITPPRRITTKYQLRDDLVGSSKAEVIAVSDYEALSDGDRCLYRAVYEDIPRAAEPIPFVIQKENGPPTQLPRGVVCTDKNNFARFPSFWHLGPVRASAQLVLARVAERLEQVIASNPYIKRSWGCGTEKPEEIVGSHRRSIFVEVVPMVVNGIEVVPKGMTSMFTTDTNDRHLTYGMVVGPIDGADLADLETKIAAYVAEATAQHAAWVSPAECPCCRKPFEPAVVVKPKAKDRRR